MGLMTLHVNTSRPRLRLLHLTGQTNQWNAEIYKEVETTKPSASNSSIRLWENAARSIGERGGIHSDDDTRSSVVRREDNLILSQHKSVRQRHTTMSRNGPAVPIARNTTLL